MESKILSFVDAMVLASILVNYIDLENIQTDPVDFIGSILDKISPMDYSTCIVLLTGKVLDMKNIPSGEELIKVVYSGLQKNKIILLLQSYKAIGF